MSGFLLNDAVYSFFNFLESLFKGADFNWLFFIGIGVMAVLIVVGIVRMATSFERKTTRCINKINRYLLQNPSITEDNLVVFHRFLQKMPRRIRDRWQLYILERDGLPSRYLTAEYCIRRPLSASALIGVRKQIRLSSILLSIVTFVFGLGYALAHKPDGTAMVGNILDYVIIYPLITPAVILLMASIFNMIVTFRYNYYNAKIYDIFAVFVRNLNRAVATLPDSIDYQVLFTQKEIDEGIPILREYLEKERLEEQRLLEQSKYAAISHSPYNFEELGVDGEQLISRAVTESESFLMKKIGLQNEIQEYEKKLAQAQLNMDEIEREANRKLQTIKENLERLEKAISETTNRVEINYNKRQVKDEMEKRAAIEKDLKSLLSKEQVTVNECNAEIEKRKELIEKDKDGVEKALKSEYNTFAVKVYDTLSDKINDENTEVVKDYQNQIVELKAKMQTLSREIEQKDALIAERDLYINTLQSNLGYAPENQTQLAGNNNELNGYVPQQPVNQDGSPNFMTEENATQNQVYYDENGNAIDYSQYYDENGNLVDYSQFYDENGNLVDYSKYYDENGNYIGPTQDELNEKQEKNVENNEQVDLEVKDESADKNVEQPLLELTSTPFVGQIEDKTVAEQTTEKPEEINESQTKNIEEKPKQTKPKTTQQKRKTTSKSKTTSKKSGKAEPAKKTTTPKTSKKKINVADETVSYAITRDDFDEIQRRIEEENKKLKQTKDELQLEIDKAISKIEKSNSDSTKAKNIKHIKDLIEQLKEKAKQAKKDGASKDEIKNINASVAELVDAITKFSSKK